MGEEGLNKVRNTYFVRGRGNVYKGSPSSKGFTNVEKRARFDKRGAAYGKNPKGSNKKGSTNSDQLRRAKEETPEKGFLSENTETSRR